MDHEDWARIDRQLEAEPLLAIIEKRLDELIVQIGEALQPPVSQATVAAHYSRFKRGGWTITVRPHGEEYFDLTLRHPKHGSLFRECWCGTAEQGPSPCGSVYVSDHRSTTCDFQPEIAPGHAGKVEKWLGEVTVYMRMGMLGPTGRKRRAN